MDTLIGVLFDAVARRGDSTMFMRRRPDGWERIKAQRVLADVESLGLALANLGIGLGDRVAIMAESRYEWALTDLAALGLGAVVVPIYPTLTAAQCRTILDNCGARALVVSNANQLAKIRHELTTLPGVDTVLVMDETRLNTPNKQSFTELQRVGAELRQRDPLGFRTRAAEVRPNSLATIIYTSGTTGEPKGVMLTHSNILFDVDACLKLVSFNSDDVALSFLPLSHIFERMGGLYGMLRAGVPIAYAQNFETVAQDAVEVRPTVINGVPRFYEKVHARVLDSVARSSPLERRIFAWGLAQLLRRARAHFEGHEVSDLKIRIADFLVARKVRKRVGGRLRICISGGAALAPETMEFFFAMGIPVQEGYGLTETSPVISLNTPGQERPGTVGKPIPGVEVRIGAEGEILTRGPHVMIGYYHNDEATRVALQDGWFHTGDVGHVDARGYLRITDRLKDLLVLAGGKKVAPQPIEARLKQGALIGEAVLIGDRKPYVVCVISPNMAAIEAAAKERGLAWRTHAELVELPDIRALCESEIAAVNATLAPFETIKRFVILDEELTQENGALTVTLKVKRRVVAAQHAERIEALYAGHELPRGV